MKTNFFILGENLRKIGEKFEKNELNEIEEITTAEREIEWIKSFYAKYLFLALENFKNENTEIPSENALFDEVVNDCFKEDKLIIIMKTNKGDVWLVSENHEWDIVDECVNITQEYINEIIDKINRTEIEEYVKTHTEDEVKEKYSVSGYEDYFWG